MNLRTGVFGDPFSVASLPAASRPHHARCAWRRRRDSNPRYRFRHNGFQDRRLQPLGHSSVRHKSYLLSDASATSLHGNFETDALHHDIDI